MYEITSHIGNKGLAVRPAHLMETTETTNHLMKSLLLTRKQTLTLIKMEGIFILKRKILLIYTQKLVSTEGNLDIEQGTIAKGII